MVGGKCSLSRLLFLPPTVYGQCILFAAALAKGHRRGRNPEANVCLDYIGLDPLTSWLEVQHAITTRLLCTSKHYNLDLS